ncbi:MAG TPA: hypothetical protein PLH57_08660 [Oligoflexia bacterium]|nr:hypothetical protein [Oligoflexia bacterium]
MAQAEGDESIVVDIDSEEQAWQGIQTRAGNYQQLDGAVVVPAEDVTDVLGNSIPFIDAFLGPLADELESVDIDRKDNGIEMKLHLLRAIKFPVASKNKKKSKKGEIVRVEVDREVAMTFRNEAFRIRFHHISGIGVVIRMPPILRIPGFSMQRLDLSAINIDFKKQKLSFMVGAANRMVRLTASVDLKEGRFEGINIWETLALNGPALIALLGLL